jgi:tetratricopeptide (TPR) repeat protein
MKAPLPHSNHVEQLGRSSRRAAMLSFMGFLLVIAALGYATLQLRQLEREREHLQTVTDSLHAAIDSLRFAVTTYREEASSARQAVAASRAAINAFHAGRLEDAVSLYDQAIAADSGNAYLQNLRAYALFRLRRYDAAIEGQQRSLAADPAYAWGYFDLARFLCAASSSNLEEAREAAERAIALRPDMRGIMQGDGEFQRVCRGILP